MKKLKVLGDYVIVKCVIRKSPIVLEGSKSPSVLERIEVYEAGEYSNLKKGQEVRIDMYLVNQTQRLFNPFPELNKTIPEKEYYLWLKRNEIIGVFK